MNSAEMDAKEADSSGSSKTSLEEQPQDSLRALASAVYVDEKISKVLDVKVIKDNPNYAKLFYRLELQGMYRGEAGLAAGLLLDLEYHPTRNIMVQGHIGRSLYMLQNGMLMKNSYAPDMGSWMDLPLAKPAGSAYIQNIELGGTYFFKQHTESFVLPQVFRVDQLYSARVGNTQVTALDISYFDHPVKVEISYGVRAGFVLDHSPITSESGVDGYIHTNDPIPLTMIQQSLVERIDSTNGWTNENTANLYLGVARLVRKGSYLDVVHRKSGAKYYVDGHSSALVYADLLFKLSQSVDAVEYYGSRFHPEVGDKPGQVKQGGTLGFRAGAHLHNGQGLAMPYSLELGLLPANGSWYIQCAWGFGSWL